MLAAVITLLIYLLVIGLCFALAVWILGLFGVAVPPRILQIVGAIILLIVLLYFLQAVVGGGHMPRII